MPLRLQYGLKLFSTNTNLVGEAKRLYDDGLYGYIELYVVPGSYKSCISYWMNICIPIIIHAPHSIDGFNLSIMEKASHNFKQYAEVKRFADDLDAKYIIIHGGTEGSIAETIRQTKRLKDSRLLLENKPKLGINGEACVGWSHNEFITAMKSRVFEGCVLDFGHAICASNSVNIDPYIFIGDFLKLNPKMYHLSDGDISAEKDTHNNMGKGSFDIAALTKAIPSGSLLTIETPRRNNNKLDDFKRDISYINRYCH